MGGTRRVEPHEIPSTRVRALLSFLSMRNIVLFDNFQSLSLFCFIHHSEFARLRPLILVAQPLKRPNNLPPGGVIVRTRGTKVQTLHPLPYQLLC